MSHRTRNLRKAIRTHDRERRLAAAAINPEISNQLGKVLGMPAVVDASAPRVPGFEIRDQPQNLDGYPGPGAINAYHCGTCSGTLVVVHVDQGVTPMFLGCRASDDCHGRMVSTGYRLDPAKLPEPTHEWYRPSLREMRQLEPAMFDHVTRGGLMLREIA